MSGRCAPDVRLDTFFPGIAFKYDTEKGRGWGGVASTRTVRDPMFGRGEEGENPHVPLRPRLGNHVGMKRRKKKAQQQIEVRPVRTAGLSDLMAEIPSHPSRRARQTPIGTRLKL